MYFVCVLCYQPLRHNCFHIISIFNHLALSIMYISNGQCYDKNASAIMQPPFKSWSSAGHNGQFNWHQRVKSVAATTLLQYWKQIIIAQCHVALI